MMSLILILTLIFALSMGRYSINFSTIIKVLISKLIDINIDWSITEQQVIESVRMPRILVAGLCGASLALGGSALQGLFRNPLVALTSYRRIFWSRIRWCYCYTSYVARFLYSYFCFFIWCNCFACCDDDC